MTLFFFLFVSHVDAQTFGEPGVSWGINIDQDFFVKPLGLNEDRNYTMGAGIAASSAGFNESFLLWPLRGVLELFGQREYFVPRRSRRIDPVHYYPASIMLVGNGFTPDSLAARDPLFEDRPYGSILGFSMKLSRLNRESLVYRSVSLTIGALGLDLSKEFQTWVHINLFNGTETRDPVIPQGWKHQISQGGEPTLLFHYQIKRLITQYPIVPRSGIAAELSSAVDVTGGYYTLASAYPIVRMGRVLQNNWVNDLKPLSIIERNPRVPLGGASDGFEFYVFGSVRPVAMLYNALLMGQFRSSVHKFSFDEVRHLYLEWNYGLGFFIPYGRFRGLRGILSVAGRTSEFRSSLSREHHWGSLYLVVTN